ncbi:MAG TPA: creatininase family protein, partial [Gemmatimonadales bacterium]|nr:creatininase family protein [Gemmatimonadales bacterium]
MIIPGWFWRSPKDTITVRELAAMTWEEVRDLGGQGLVAILPAGAVEAHGPHLPLDTDVVIASAMARAA